MIVQIDREASVPVRAQIAGAYAKAIGEGELAAGAALPSVRALSNRLGVSPVTVAAAYRQLCDSGLINAVPRSGFRVAGVKTPPEATRRVFQLNRIEPDLRVHPVAECAHLMAELAAADPAIGGYAEYRGELALRQAIVALDAELGIVSDAAEGVLISAGAQQALTLLGRSLPAGCRVAVEDPCYPGARLAFSGAGASLVPLTLGDDGPDPAALRALANPGEIVAFYCCPSHANPGGRSWSTAARQAVLQAARQGGALLIEDDYLGDLDEPGSAPPRLAALASGYPGVRVVRIHTFSKTLLPALRLASISGEPALIARLLALKVADDLGCSAYLQRTLAAFIERGQYHRHLARVRPRYAAVRETLRGALGALAPAVVFEGPFAGFCMLGRLAPGIDAGRFLAECARLGVLLTPGAEYWFDGRHGHDRFRIGFGSLAAEEVLPVIAVLEQAAVAAANPEATRSLL